MMSHIYNADNISTLWTRYVVDPLRCVSSRSLVKTPVPTSGWVFECRTERREEVFTRPLIGPEAGEMVGVNLAIHQRYGPAFELLHEGDEGYFGRVAHLREHGLSKERCAQGHAVESANQLIP